VPKVNVYLPDELAAEARDAQLSLSAVCQEAIRKELHRLDAQRRASEDIQAVVERLRQTISEKEDVQRSKGRADGVEWAREWASMRELRFSATEYEPVRGGQLDAEHFPTLCAFVGAAERANVISVTISDEGEEGVYWDGFIAGAVEVLDQVEALL
jgi:post-segregation antitoxin (ccd killing protein)